MIKSIALKLFKIAVYFALICLTFTVIAAVLLRFMLMPNINSYKDDIANFASSKVGPKITIGHINADWDGINPHFTLTNIDIFDSQNRSALNFKHTEVNLSWLSIPLLNAKLAMLKINSPHLTIRRAADGKLFVAGLDMSATSRPEFPNWLLKQRNIDINNATVIWQDDLRKAPAISLNQLNFHLENPTIQSLISQHQFTVSATPSIGSTTPILMTGHFHGSDVTQINTWHGKITTVIKGTDLSVWKQWVDYPVNLQSGFGNASLTVDFANAELEKVTGDFDLSNLTAQLSSEVQTFKVKTLSGKLSFASDIKNQVFKGESLKIITNNGLNIQRADIVIAHALQGKKTYGVTLNVDDLDLDAASKLAKELSSYKILPTEWLETINAIAPAGQLTNLSTYWLVSAEKTLRYNLDGHFNGLTIQPYNKIPGFNNFRGSIKANQENGKVTFNTKNAVLNLKQILRLPVPIDHLTGELSWEVKSKVTLFTTKSLFVSNPHIAGIISGHYKMNSIKGGYLDLNAKFSKGNAKYAYYYYPISLGADTLHWLDTSILSGRAEDVNLVVKGNLADFPYVDKNHHADKSLGIFKVKAKLSDIQLEFGTGWPEIEGLGLDMLFEGARMELKANKGHIFGNKIVTTHVEIPVLDADFPMLNIVSEVQGPVSDAIMFVNKSPVKEVTLGFTDNLKTTGNGNLHLELKIPMQDIVHAKYKGSYQITNGSIGADADLGLPELSRIYGKLNFSESNLQATNMMTWVYGGPAQFSLTTDKDKIIRINARGRVVDSAIKQTLGPGIADHITGTANWAGEITIKKPLVDFAFRTTLVGMAIELPAPFNKASTEQSVLRIDKNQLNASTSNLTIGYANLLNAKILLNQQNGITTIDRGEIGIKSPVELPQQKGLSIRGSLDYLDADAWRDVLSGDIKKASNADNIGSMNINKAEFNIKVLDIFDRRLNNLVVRVKPANDGWKGSLQSKEINGNLQWINSDNGKIIARLKDFTVPDSSPSNETSAATDTVKNHAKKDYRKLAQHYPALDIIVDNIELAQKNLGKLELVAFENDEDWNIQKLKISNEDSTLSADGEWHNWTRNPNTKLNFTWDINHVDKTLRRFGQPDTVKGGIANLSGQLSWPGSPHEFETNGLNGNFKLTSAKGQIVKVQPGVGRLLGLLSLQSLPRRLTLDFRDLFSSGFAYDRINATAKIDNGIMRSDDFYMTGPAAEVSIKGETNLQKETQILNVKVIPHVSDSLSLAAFAGGPIAGVAAFVAQKLLKDPLNKVIAAEYKIVGTWDNPQELSGDKLNNLKESAKDNSNLPLIAPAAYP
ncbi:MAG: TIGR02099 family protein [Methylophilaceae bacterium]|nr:TIGR02099 family protein [Methylophilaceae bacterium]